MHRCIAIDQYSKQKKFKIAQCVVDKHAIGAQFRDGLCIYVHAWNIKKVPFVKRYQTVVLSVYLVCPVCDVGVLCPNGWMDQGETWHGGSSRRRPHCVISDPDSAESGM